jgi:hypothetical protein
MKSARLIVLGLALSLAVVSTASAQDSCDIEYADCMVVCRQPGPPAPGCVSKCNQAYVNCEAGGVCSPFCPP